MSSIPINQRDSLCRFYTKTQHYRHFFRPADASGRQCVCVYNEKHLYSTQKTSRNPPETYQEHAQKSFREQNKIKSTSAL